MYVGKNTVIRDSVIMPNAQIGDNVVIDKTIVGSNAIINHGCRIGNGASIEVVGAYQYIVNESTITLKEICLDDEVINI